MHAMAALLLKTARYRETIAPDDLDTCIKTIRSLNVKMQLPSFSFVCYTNPSTDLLAERHGALRDGFPKRILM